LAILSEFREFALRGNLVDLAIGVIVGAAFSRIVDSLVGDVFMPVLGFVAGGLDFSNYFIQLSGAPAQTYAQAKQAGATLGYGQFITVALNFLIVAFVLFLVIRAMNRLQSAEEKKPEAAAELPADVKLLGEIRDILAAKPKV
jgi:large conductance mechanosensitive channel